MGPGEQVLKCTTEISDRNLAERDRNLILVSYVDRAEKEVLALLEPLFEREKCLLEVDDLRALVESLQQVFFARFGQWDESKGFALDQVRHRDHRGRCAVGVILVRLKQILNVGLADGLKGNIPKVDLLVKDAFDQRPERALKCIALNRDVGRCDEPERTLQNQGLIGRKCNRHAIRDGAKPEEGGRKRPRAGYRTGMGLRHWEVLIGIALTNLAWSAPISPSFPPPVQPKPGSKMLLIPVDDRPATGQFAQMISSIGGVQIEMPPVDLLGQFLTPGRSEAVLNWLSQKNLGEYSAVIVSTDMIAYGGLVASRVPAVSLTTAVERLQRLEAIRARTPGVPFYGFSAVMRVLPTSTRENRPWRDLLGKLVVRRERFFQEPSLTNQIDFLRLANKLPAGVLEEYDEARQRNQGVQEELIRMTKRGSLDYLILGQDDAQTEGPQISEGRVLRELVAAEKARDKVYFCEGIDQHANVLVSRAMLAQVGYVPKIRMVFADPLGTTVTPAYETQPLSISIKEQVTASGAMITNKVDDADYTLYVNTPQPRPGPFDEFVSSLQNEIDQGFPIAVADLNLGKSGTGDPNLFQVLNQGDRAMRLLSYAGWNTAGNTLGTSIPAANVYLAARRFTVDPLTRELNQRAFLLHRLVNDFEYHRFTRPMAYAYIDRNPPSTREETYGTNLDAVNRLVQEDLSRRLDDMFRSHFQGRRFFAGTRQYEVRGLSQVDIELPWPRAYEVRLGFKIDASEVRR